MRLRVTRTPSSAASTASTCAVFARGRRPGGVGLWALLALQEAGRPVLTPADLALAVQVRPMVLGPLLLTTREKIAAACCHAVSPQPSSDGAGPLV